MKTARGAEAAYQTWIGHTYACATCRAGSPCTSATHLGRAWRALLPRRTPPLDAVGRFTHTDEGETHMTDTTHPTSADDGKHGGNPAPIKPWTPPAPPNPDGSGPSSHTGGMA
ncbi:hypothetical protein GTW44_06555 [Streptomyces sp. SID8360]|nr:hypothetical protein SACTE_2282 [Streptomyces sp. SirexAA-E]MYR66972.1 hypothetical protein [Streptomyces sp. SID4939]MYS00904.1 hypothetical protein [Streptomyces sp. SID4940]MYT65326.1 hypothetical protein [Streptomyces sp. SID8357]MYT84381.1 hypothetical protein [Streptomyces sp. SID8360]MYW37647.1 hypothetical protein [Streptomyces sp. SID1]MYX71795.1 hypothetical protein [Streptomyces sp. SID3915]PZX33430.1 hypothetical protein K373_05122 [Streptomyces sp. DvalAA-21]RAJ29313.1 hypot